jgi:pilus assembly protein Flp/PilA
MQARSAIAACDRIVWFTSLVKSMRVGWTRGRNVMKVITALRSFVRRDEGQDLLEYALLISLIALVCVGAITTAGGNVKGIFEKIAAAL